MFPRTLMVLGVCVAAGCHRPVSPVEPTGQDLHLADPDEYDLLFDTCVDVLRAHRFRPDRLDRRAGIITSFPVTSQHFFEFWRRDVETAYDFMEASLVTVRRRVEIRLVGEDDPQRRQLVVTVYREKFSTPDRQYNSSAAAFRVFSRSLPSTAGKRIIPEQDDAWLPAGRDGALERRLLEEITEQVFAREWPPSEAGDPPFAGSPAEG